MKSLQNLNADLQSEVKFFKRVQRQHEKALLESSPKRLELVLHNQMQEIRQLKQQKSVLQN